MALSTRVCVSQSLVSGAIKSGLFAPCFYWCVTWHQPKCILLAFLSKSQISLIHSGIKMAQKNLRFDLSLDFKKVAYLHKKNSFVVDLHTFATGNCRKRPPVYFCGWFEKCAKKLLLFIKRCNSIFACRNSWALS